MKMKYFLATRPWSFVVSIMPVVACTAWLYSQGYMIHWGIALWTVIGAVLFHAAANVLSDYHDFCQKVDTIDTFGATTITQGVLTAQQMQRFGIILLMVAIANGLGLMAVCGWQLLIIGGLGALFSVGYSWLKYHALGDVDILFNFGILPVLGTSLTVTGNIVWSSLWVVLAVVPITLAVLHSNNTRDIATDHQAGITTLPILIGVKASQIYYDVLVLLPCAWVVVCVCLGKMSPFALFILVSLKIAIHNVRTMQSLSSDAHAIDHLDQQTAQQQLISGSLLTLSLLIAGLISTIAW